jgi:molybdopterin biosynthesis enzyme
MDLAVRGDAKVEAIRLADALAAIRTQLWPILDTEGVDISGARGRVLATDLVAKVNLPHWDSAAVDGFAVRGPDLVPDRINRLTAIGEAAAGHPFAGYLGSGQAVRILTGAPLPGGPMLSSCRRYAASMAQISLLKGILLAKSTGDGAGALV